MTPDELEHALFYWPAVMANPRNEWAAKFAKGIFHKLRNRRWTPTAKQAAIMHDLLADVVPDDGTELQVIE